MSRNLGHLAVLGRVSLGPRSLALRPIRWLQPPGPRSLQKQMLVPVGGVRHHRLATSVSAARRALPPALVP